MPSSVATFDLAGHWQPVAHSLSRLGAESGSLADCADSVLGAVELIRQELIARAVELEQTQRQLAQREEHLTQQRTEHARLCSQFEQQEARLTDTMEELRRLREELAGRATPSTLAVDSARAALEQYRELWQKDRAEMLERLNALAIMQQTGTGDGEAVKAFCHELTEIHDLITSSHHQTKEAIDRERKEFNERLALVTEAKNDSPLSDAAFNELRNSLHDLRDQLTALQAQSTTGTREKDELFQRLDALAQGRSAASEEGQILESIQRELAEMRRIVESVPAAAGSSPEHDQAIASLRGEVESLRHLADEARQQASRQEAERALVEAELDRIRTQAAQWRREREEEAARHHEEERLWREELQELRHLIRQAAASSAESPAPAEAGSDSAPNSQKPAESQEPDPIANSLMAQFTKLQKDSARRRTRGANS